GVSRIGRGGGSCFITTAQFVRLSAYVRANASASAFFLKRRTRPMGYSRGLCSPDTFKRYAESMGASLTMGTTVPVCGDPFISPHSTTPYPTARAPQAARKVVARTRRAPARVLCSMTAILGPRELFFKYGPHLPPAGKSRIHTITRGTV